jgi:hypothetical protein
LTNPYTASLHHCITASLHHKKSDPVSTGVSFET